MEKYNIAKIKISLAGFKACKGGIKLIRNIYDKSYISTSSDEISSRIRSNLLGHFNKIENGFTQIEQFWNSFVEDVINTDKALAGQNASISSEAVSNLIISIPDVSNIKIDIGTVKDAILVKTDALYNLQSIKSMSIEEYCCSAVTTLGAEVTGVLQFFEHLGEFILLFPALRVMAVTTIFDKEAGKKVGDFIVQTSKEDASIVFKEIFENTETGKAINEASNVQFGSDTYNLVEDISEEATGLVIAIASGGADVSSIGIKAIPKLMKFGLGFFQAGGEKLSDSLNEDDSDLKGSVIEGLFNGVAGGIDFLGTSEIASNFFKLKNVVKSSGGIKSVINKFKFVKLKNFNTKTMTAKQMVNAIKNYVMDDDTIAESIEAAFDNFSYDKKTGVEFDSEGFAKDLAFNIAVDGTVNVFNKKIDIIDTSESKMLDFYKKHPELAVYFSEYTDLEYKGLKPDFVNTSQQKNIYMGNYFELYDKDLNITWKIKEDMDPNKAKEIFELYTTSDNIDKNILKNDIDTIILRDSEYHPNNDFWAKYYNKEDFIAAAYGGGGVIDMLDITRPDTLYHESAHCSDINTVFSSSSEWNSAALKDGNFASQYAYDAYHSHIKNKNYKGIYMEDFADSISRAKSEPAKFKRECPNRYKQLKEWGLI